MRAWFAALISLAILACASASIIVVRGPIITGSTAGGGGGEPTFTDLPFVKVILSANHYTFTDSSGTTACTDLQNCNRWSNNPALTGGHLKGFNVPPVWHSTGAGTNSLPFLRFVNSGDTAMFADGGNSINLSIANTVFMVIRFNPQDSAVELFLDSTCGGSREAAYLRTDNKLYVSSDGTSELAGTALTTDWQVLTIIFENSPNNTIIRTNGTQMASGSISGSSWDFCTLGSVTCHSIGDGYSWSGDISELIVCNTNLATSSYLSDAENRLKTKYGIP